MRQLLVMKARAKANRRSRRENVIESPGGTVSCGTTEVGNGHALNCPRKVA
jgi:hypothetical protein